MKSWKTLLAGLLAVPLMLMGSLRAEDSASYVIVVKSVSVKKTTKEGNAWDINNGAPDLMVIVKNASEADSKEFKTKEKQDTFSAAFNEVTTVRMRPDQEVTIEVVDVDVASNDTIGKITRKLTASELKEGKLELKNFGQVIRLELEMKSLK